MKVLVLLSGGIDSATVLALALKDRHECRALFFDYDDVESVVAPLIAQLDHRCLNEIEGLENPTAECIAFWLWEHISPRMPLVVAVRVYETPDCWAEYAFVPHPGDDVPPGKHFVPRTRERCPSK